MLTIETGANVSGLRLEKLKAFIAQRGLRLEETPDYTAFLTDDGRIMATGSLCGNVLKYIAVSEEAEGEGACASIVSELVSEAFRRGVSHLMLCTKPANADAFASLGFYALAKTRDMALMENKRHGLDDFLAGIPKCGGSVGAVVMNADPFTLGHQFLLETAASQVDALQVFVVSEDRSRFSSAARYDMVKLGAQHIKNAFVHHSDRYLVSYATFPAYFMKDTVRAEDARAELDIALFTNRIAPALNISARFVGTEPYSPLTERYNQLMMQQLPKHNIRYIEIPRINGISASRVRGLIDDGKLQEIRGLVPDTTYEYIKNNA